MRATLLIAIAFACVFGTAFNKKEKKFEGKIKYDITYVSVPAQVEGMESMLPQEMTMYVKGDKVAILQDVMGGSQRVIADNAANTADILMDMMGQKIHIHMTSEEINEAAKDAEKPVIAYQDEKLTVAGYSCKKATMVNGDTETVLYYTKKLGSITHKDFKDLDGFPLKYETKTQGMSLEMTASEVTKATISDDEFSIPAGYTTMTMEELTGMMGGK